MKKITIITTILLLSATCFCQSTIKVTTSSSSSAKTVYTQAGADAVANKVQSNATAYTNGQLTPVWTWIKKADSIINALNAVTVKQQDDINKLKTDNAALKVSIAEVDKKRQQDSILFQQLRTQWFDKRGLRLAGDTLVQSQLYFDETTNSIKRNY